jgi:hypothetical protein
MRGEGVKGVVGWQRKLMCIAIWRLPVVILNESAGEVKDLCFGNESSFAAAQDDNPKGISATFY